MDIEKLLSNLDEDQRRAVTDPSPALLVDACVGSGKTRTLVTRALYEKANGLSPSAIAVLTFTNKAAEEVRARFAAIDAEHVPPLLGTFHAVALKLLRNTLPVEQLGRDTDFSVISPDEELQLADSLIAARALDIKYRRQLTRRMEQGREGRWRRGSMKEDDDIRTLLSELDQEKRRRNLMDFDDLIETATSLLSQVAWAPDWVGIDELQDCDSAQLSFLRALVKPGTRVFAVGDDNQAVYSWRGGSGEAMARFCSLFHAQRQRLRVNYRSSGTILKTAQRFLDGGSLSGNRGEGAKIELRPYYDPFMEAEDLAEQIISRHDSGTPWNRTAVLFRLQKQSKPLEEALKRRGIPFSTSVHQTLADCPAALWLIRVLRGACGDNDSAVEALTDKIYGDGLSRRKALTALANASSPLAAAMAAFPQWAVSGTIDTIGDFFDLNRRLGPTRAGYAEESSQTAALLKRLPHGSLTDSVKIFLADAALYEGSLTDDASPTDAVRLSTLHACKGLEWDNVFIIGVNPGLLPLKTGTPGSDIDEERRLFYVGLTRARDRLQLSWYNAPPPPVRPGPSLFLSGIPRHLCAETDGSLNTVSPVDLQEYRHRILERRTDPQSIAKAPPQAKTPQTKVRPRRVRHCRYGEGVIVFEDNNTLTVDFGPLGQKKFSKEICPLKFLDP